MNRSVGLLSGLAWILALAISWLGSEPPVAPPADPGESWIWRLPAGFPQPRVPAENPMTVAKVELGRRLFYDLRFSGAGGYACASCHEQRLAFTDGRARALGASGERHSLSSMSLTNVAYAASLGWADAGLRRLEDQAQVPMFNQHPIELGMAGREAEVEARLAADSLYRRMFASAFPTIENPLDLDHAVLALASFERTLISGDSPYDRLLFHDQRGALSAAARRGMRMFFSQRLRCFECHAGFNFSGPVDFVGAQPSPLPLAFHNTGLYNLDLFGSYPEGARGLWQHSREPGDMGRFKAPTLRNIALTAPYMHDGSVPTLAAVLDHYAAGGRTLASGAHAGVGYANPHKSALVAGFEFERGQRDDLVAFLDSLTDQTLVEDPALASPF